MLLIVYAGSLAVSLVISLALTPVIRLLAPKLGAMDNPGALAIHSKPTPRLGGLAIFMAFFITAFVAAKINGSQSAASNKLLAILLSSIIIAGVGFLDDMRRIAPRVKFIGQLLAPIILVLFGIEVGFIPILYIAIPLTIFYGVGGCNAMNLLDGMDGLAAGISAISSFFFSLLFLHQGNPLGVILSLALLGASLGFLIHNFPPAKIFMGDTGSLFSGFMLAALAVMLTTEPFHVIGLIAPIWVIGVPVFDTSLAILRRLVDRSSLFTGDRSHSYDILMRRGCSPKKTLLIFYALGGLFGFTALILVRSPGIPVCILLFCEVAGLVFWVVRMNLLGRTA